MEQQSARRMPRGEPATPGAYQQMERENFPSGLSGASTPRPLRAAAFPSEVTNAGATTSYECVESKAANMHRHELIPSEENTQRRILEAGSKTPHTLVRSKAGELKGYGTESTIRDNEETWSALEGAMEGVEDAAIEGDRRRVVRAASEGDIERVGRATTSCEERRRRRLILEHEMRLLDIEDDLGGERPVEQPLGNSVPAVRREAEFEEWIRGMENSMQLTARQKCSPVVGQFAKGHDLYESNTRTLKHSATQHGHATYEAPVQQQGYATQSRYVAPYGRVTQSDYAVQPRLRKQEGYATHPENALHYEHTARHAYTPHAGYVRTTHGAQRNTHISHEGYGHTMHGTQYNTRPLIHSTTLSQSQIAARQPVPKDLPIFSGVVDDWLVFITAYDRTTASCGYTDDENVTRLLHALKGPALDAVGHLLSFPDGLNEAIETLRSLYGRPDLIVESMIRKIRGMAAPKVEDLSTVVQFGFAVKRLVGAVNASGLLAYMYDVTLLKELVRKLPPVLCIDWARTRKTMQEVTMIEFGTWISELASDLCDVIDMTPSPEVQNVARRQPETSLNQHRYQQQLQPRRSHPQRFQPARPDQQRPYGTGRVHPTYCNATVLQEESDGVLEPMSQIQVPTTACAVCGNNSGTGTGNVFAHTGANDGALLKYVPISLHGPAGRVDTYAFLDDGSTSTFMDHGLLAELGLSGTPHPLCLQWTGDIRREEKESVKLSVCVSAPHETSTVHEMSEVHTVKELALPKQTMHMTRLAANYAHLRGLPVDSYEEAMPRVLIGVDNCRLSQPLKSVEGKCDEPVASKTRLGWVVYGPCTNVRFTPESQRSLLHVCSCDGSPDDRLTAAVKEYFKLESIGISTSTNSLQSKDDERALAILERETKLIDGRYETGLIWRRDDPDLPCNKAAATKRYVCLKQKMSKDPVLSKAIQEKMQEYLAKGYIRKLADFTSIVRQKNDWYLPIFPVTNPNKPGKIRMVFDAAAKVNGVSLNSRLLSGPDMLAGLVSVLMKFRENRVAIVGDIREMFHQVAIKEKDQRSQMILWDGEDPDAGPAIYVVTVMTFGAACSPSSAQYVKNVNAGRFATEYPRAVECIVHEHYVDDMLASVETEEEAKDLADAVRYIHACGGFEIRNWVSNSRAVMQHLQEDTKGKNISANYGLSTEKVLGMWWNTSSDTFTFRLSTRHDQELLSGKKPGTKREILRTLMSVYDPLGLLGHFLMYLKTLLQEVWRGGTGWDQELSDQTAGKWTEWLHVLPDVEQVTIPRCYRCISSTDANVELHVFCDASEKGMAAVAYFRFEEGRDMHIECALVGSKTRVAPLKFLSIPRLELQAAVIGARLAKTISQNHRLSIGRTIFWTDSKNVLSWLNSDHRRYNQFVAFRIGELLEGTNLDQWRWVPTKLNVADEGTKWSKRPDLSAQGRWFRGPSFLWEPESAWPNQEGVPQRTSEELRKGMNHHLAERPLIHLERFSRWNRALRAMAFVTRFITNMRHLVKKELKVNGPLTQDELAEAERILIRFIQQKAYRGEMQQLKNRELIKHPWKKRIDKGSSLYKLSPTLDDHGILRVGGRLTECVGISEPSRNPIILPRKEYGTDLLMQAYHARYKHVNHGTALAALRMRYYSPKILGEYRRIRISCQKCKVDNARPEPLLMGNLPLQRVAVGQNAFSFTGIDYFGPFLVAVGRRVEKRWGVIFTCLTSRAVHLEIAASLNTASCILAIRRFIARRGTPLEIISDRGTNFVGASRELDEAAQEIDHDAMMTVFCGPQTKWSFNPPGAPHFGGCWERLVRSVKKVLNQFVFPKRPTDEILASTFAEIELILNSRPLTYVPLDDEMTEPMTPNLLLLGTPDGSKPPAVFCDSPAALKSSWKMAQHAADLFWKKWLAEYLPTLTRRTKWFQPVRPLEKLLAKGSRYIGSGG
uniref:uncharacterized protein LOC120956082 n=1 Tax=Anopheles coluzzii TaxID=1518534 RepID=UPI0020FF900C|nr:uncharacterized protein LOC120956082 [Anopheles coluzzii]